MLFLTGRDVASLLDLDECIQAVRSALLEAARNPLPSGILALYAPAGGFHVKTSLLGGDRLLFAAKVNSNFPDNAARGLPTIQGLLVLSDGEDGRPLAVMDSAELTARRTAAATAVAAAQLAAPGARVATIVGCGVQGEAQLRAVCRVLKLERVLVSDTAMGHAHAFAARMAQELGIEVEPAGDCRAAARASDVIVTCTTSRRALLGPDDVSAGAFVAAVGADNGEKLEIEPALMARAAVVVDSLAQCTSTGDLSHALAAGTMKREDVRAELGQVLAGIRPGRRSADEIVIFDSTGIGLLDAAAAAVVYRNALRKGWGLEAAL